MATGALIFLLIIVAALAAMIVIAMLRWRASMRRLRDRLIATQYNEPMGSIELDALSLPPPVARYLKMVLKPDQKYVSLAEIKQRGYFNLGLGTGEGEDDNWKPFKAMQLISTRRPGFIWDARIYMAPQIAATVCDSYVDGEGMLVGKLLGMFKLLEVRGTKDVSEGELMRFFAEAPWYPTALIPNQQLTWEAGMDDDSALAKLSDVEIEISALFRFNREGLIDVVEMDRLRLVNGKSIRTKWVGRFAEYERHEGMLIPGKGEVSWVLDGSERAYWRGKLVDVRFEYFE